MQKRALNHLFKGFIVVCSECVTDSGAYSLRFRTKQLTQDGCAGFLNQPNKRLSSTSLLHAAS